MPLPNSRRLAAVIAGALSLGLVLNQPVLAANEGQPGSKSCMSDDQLRSFMLDVVITLFPREADICVEKAGNGRDAVLAARKTFTDRSAQLGQKVANDVVETFRPAYGNDAPNVRAAALDAAVTPSLDYARTNWTGENCATFVQNINSLSNEVAGLDPGPTIRGLMDQGFSAERALVPRCPN